MSAVLADPEVTRRTVRLTEAVEISPKADRSVLTDTTQVSFVPMAAVGAGNGQIDTSTIRPYAEVKKGYTHFRDGDVLFAKITPCMENGKMAVAHGLHNGAGLGSTEFHVLRPRAGVDSRYVYHFVSSAKFRNEAAHHMTGAVGQKRVPVSFLEQSEIPLPSLHEQRRIVAEIEKQFSRLDQAVASLQRVKAQLKRYKACALKAAVEGRLVEIEAERARREGRGFETGERLLERILETRRSQWEGKGKYKEPAAPETADLPELPEGWCWSSTDQLAEVGTGATPNRSNATFFDGGDIPWVTSAVVNAPFVDKASELVTRAALLQTNLTEYPPGTLLVAMYGEGKTRGKCSELRITAATNQALAAVQADPSVRSYLKIFLEHNYEETRKVASGGVQPNLNLSLVRAIRVPLPPLREQHRIVAEVDRRLSIVREVEAEVDANLKRAQALRQAVLTSAFTRKSFKTRL